MLFKNYGGSEGTEKSRRTEQEAITQLHWNVQPWLSIYCVLFSSILSYLIPKLSTPFSKKMKQELEGLSKLSRLHSWRQGGWGPQPLDPKSWALFQSLCTSTVRTREGVGRGTTFIDDFRMSAKKKGKWVKIVYLGKGSSHDWQATVSYRDTDGSRRNRSAFSQEES